MDVLANNLERLSAIIEDMIPNPVPVPPLLTSAAEACAQFATSPSFPYRINRVDLADVILWQALLVTLLHPLIWNCIGRFEHYTRLLSKIFIKPVIGVYALALWIFLAGLYRDALFIAAMNSQEKFSRLGAPLYQIGAYVIMTVGLVLVFSSFFQLGMTGTYLGDYFGILMQKRVTGFPFNLFSDPMYDGSTMIFLAKAIFAKSPAGILMAGWVYIVYRIACLFEGPFTAKIYASRADKKKEN